MEEICSYKIGIYHYSHNLENIVAFLLVLLVLLVLRISSDSRMPKSTSSEPANKGKSVEAVPN